jgi:hypothetical protein
MGRGINGRYSYFTGRGFDPGSVQKEALSLFPRSPFATYTPYKDVMRKFSIIKSEKTLKEQLLQELMGCYIENFRVNSARKLKPSHFLYVWAYTWKKLI